MLIYEKFKYTFKKYGYKIVCCIRRKCDGLN